MIPRHLIEFLSNHIDGGQRLIFDAMEAMRKDNLLVPNCPNRQELEKEALRLEKQKSSHKKG